MFRKQKRSVPGYSHDRPISNVKVNAFLHEFEVLLSGKEYIDGFWENTMRAAERQGKRVGMCGNDFLVCLLSFQEQTGDSFPSPEFPGKQKRKESLVEMPLYYLELKARGI
jgi:hypothetical protein